jgi:hypothetical protein
MLHCQLRDPNVRKIWVRQPQSAACLCERGMRLDTRCVAQKMVQNCQRYRPLSHAESGKEQFLVSDSFGEQAGRDELLTRRTESKQMLAAIRRAAGLSYVSLRLEARQRPTRDGLIHLR